LFQSPGAASSANEEEPIENHSRGEAADVRPPGNPRHPLPRHAGDGAAEELRRRPEQEIDPRRHLEEEGKEKDRKQDDDPGVGKQNEVGAEHPGDGARCADRRNGRIDIRIKMGDPRDHAGQEIKKEKPCRSHQFLDVVAEDPEGPHIADQVDPPAVKEHAGEKRAVSAGRQSEPKRPVGMAVAGRHQSKEVKEPLLRRRIETCFIEKNGGIHRDQHPGHYRRGPAGDRVTDRNHLIPLLEVGRWTGGPTDERYNILMIKEAVGAFRKEGYGGGPMFSSKYFPQFGFVPSMSVKPYSSARPQELKTFPDFRKTSGSEASAAIARPIDDDVSEAIKCRSFLPPSRQFASVTVKWSFIAPERRKQGVTASVV